MGSVLGGWLVPGIFLPLGGWGDISLLDSALCIHWIPEAPRKTG